jgi:tripartite-type tricarboxylate transporter receptor subunit TctC
MRTMSSMSRGYLFAMSVLLAAFVAPSASAQTYPSKTIRLIVPFPPCR